MGIFEIVDEKRTILPVKVPDVDIYHTLQEIKFDPMSMQGEVAADYIAGVMDLYRDAGGREDILERVIREHFGDVKEDKVAQLRRELKPNLPWQKPKMVPWALYEIVAEEVRRELAKQKGFEEKVDLTVFPFLIGVYSLVAHPAVVLSSSVLSVEGLIENVNRFGKRLNTVTTMETLEQGKYDSETGLMRAKLRRQQDQEALRALDDLMRKQGSKSEGVSRAICNRDLATVCGALVGGSLLKGQRLRYIEVTGDAQGTTDITIYYPQTYRGRMQPSRIIDAFGLAATARRAGSKWREGYIAENLDAATAPLNAVASKMLSRRIEALTRAEEAEIRISRLRELAREASHHVKNPASALLGILQKLAPDEEEIFRDVKDDDERRMYTHRQIVKEIVGTSGYRIEGVRGREVQLRLGARYEAYQQRARAAGINPLARRVFDPLCGTYTRAEENASIPILDRLIEKITKNENIEEKERELLDFHYQRVRKGLEDAERIADDIIARTKSLSTLAKEEFTREEITKEGFLLYDAIVEGIRLLEMQPDKPSIVINVALDVRVISHRPTIVSTVENIIWNAYEAIQGKAGVDTAYKGEAVVMSYDQERETMYIGNTGPSIPNHRIAEIFSLQTKTAIARGGLKKVTGTGTSMALKRDMLAALEQRLTCYDEATVRRLREEYDIFERYRVNTIFGIEFKS